MTDKHDKFGDVVAGHRGIFAESVDEHDRVRSSVAAEGAKIEFQCSGCTSAKQLTLEWPELVALKYGLDPAQVFKNGTVLLAVPATDPMAPPPPPMRINPAEMLTGEPMGWSYVQEENLWAPRAKCEHCQWNLIVRMAPDEPEQLLAKGRRSRFIKPKGEQVVSLLCAQVSQLMQSNGSRSAYPVMRRG